MNSLVKKIFLTTCSLTFFVGAIDESFVQGPFTVRAVEERVRGDSSIEEAKPLELPPAQRVRPFNVIEPKTIMVKEAPKSNDQPDNLPVIAPKGITPLRLSLEPVKTTAPWRVSLSNQVSQKKMPLKQSASPVKNIGPIRPSTAKKSSFSKGSGRLAEPIHAFGESQSDNQSKPSVQRPSSANKERSSRRLGDDTGAFLVKTQRRSRSK